MKTTVLMAGACCLLTSACGPTLAIKAGVEQAGANILFGRPPASPAPPTVVSPVVPGFPAPIEMPPLPPAQLAPLPTTTPACPTASPLATPDLLATADVGAPPVAATYVFRYSGTDTIDPGQADATVTKLTGYGTRQVTDVQSVPAPNPAQAASYTFNVVETYDGYQQTNGYEIEPSGPAQVTATGTSPAAGIYLTEMTIQQAGSGTQPDVFRPTTPIQISTFPEEPGATFQGAGSDGHTTMEIDPNTISPNSGIVTGRVNVDACGSVLQAWRNLLAGRISTVEGPGPNETFTLELDFGTQYGGLSLMDHLVVDYPGSSTVKPEQRDITATIDEQPQLPAS